MIEFSAVLLLLGVCLAMHFFMHGRRPSRGERARAVRTRAGHEPHDRRQHTGHGCH